MTKIFIVFKHDYDDCEIYAAFSELEVAEKYSALVPDSDIMKMELDEHVGTAQEGYTYWWVRIDWLGSVKAISMLGPTVPYDERVFYEKVVDHMSFTVRAASQQGAIAVAMDMMGRIIDAKLWGNEAEARRLWT